MRLGRVGFVISYVVDLDNAEMVNHARTAVSDDVIAAAVDFDELDANIKAEEDSTVSEDDIPSWLLEEEN